MLTIFSIPKPFHGHVEIIQRNAIRSWTLLYPACEIVLFGNEDGTEQIATEFNLDHVRKVARNEYGTPLVSDLFGKIPNVATKKLLCYVNADVILMNDFMNAVRKVLETLRHFLIIGRKWKVNINHPLNFEPDWEQKLLALMVSQGELGSPFGMDYFVYPREICWDIPPFAVGRPMWDNWLVHKTLEISIPVVDVTETTMVVHQNHDFSHVPFGDGMSVEGPETDINRKLGTQGFRFGVLDSNYRLTPDGMEQLTPHLSYRERLIRRLPITNSKFVPFFRLVRKHIRIIRKI